MPKVTYNLNKGKVCKQKLAMHIGPYKMLKQPMLIAVKFFINLEYGSIY